MSRKRGPSDSGTHAFQRTSWVRTWVRTCTSFHICCSKAVRSHRLALEVHSQTHSKILSFQLFFWALCGQTQSMSRSQWSPGVHAVQEQRQRYRIRPREPRWRIAFRCSVTSLPCRRWPAPLPPPSSHIPTVRAPLLRCHSIPFFIRQPFFSPLRQNSAPPPLTEIKFPELIYLLISCLR